MSRLLYKPEAFAERRQTFGFEYLSFETRRLAQGRSCTGSTADSELALIVLGGCCSVRSGHGHWPGIGRRRNVFEGKPYTLYLPVHCDFTVTADADCDLAFCYCRAEKSFPARLLEPDEVRVEVRGGGNATRQIHHLLAPEFPADRLLVVEVYTPSGNWSSYPPHKHDRHAPPGEVDLEEIYYYRVDRPEGYAIQRVYTPTRSIDETITVRDGELVIIPEGYHPVVAAHGYNVYYLNALAGSMRSMAASDDPDYAWVRREWPEPDPRVPLF